MNIVKNKFNSKNILNLTVSNSLYLFVELFLSRILTFILYISISQFFGTTLFGIYTYIASVIFLISPIINLGMNSIIQQELSLAKKNDNTIVTTTIFLKTIASVVVFFTVVIIIIFFGFEKVDHNIYFLIALTSLLFIGPITIIPSWQSYNLQIKDKVKVNITSILVEKCLQILAIIFFKSFIFIFISMIIGTFVKAFYFLYFYIIKSEGRINYKYIDYFYAINLVKKSLPLLFTAFLIYIYSRVDQIMIAHILGYRDLGFYSSSAILFQSVFTISGIITTSLYPLLLREIRKKNDDDEYRSFLQCYFDIYTIFGFIFFIILFIFSPLILSLFGSEFSEYSHILQLFSFTLFFVFCLDGFNKLLISKSKYKILFYINLFSVLMNIILNFVFIKFYGIFGAAIGTSLSMIFSILVFPIFSKHSRHFVIYVLKSYFFIFRIFKTINLIKNYKIKSL